MTQLQTPNEMCGYLQIIRNVEAVMVCSKVFMQRT